MLIKEGNEHPEEHKRAKVIPEKIIESCNECYFNGEDGCGMVDDLSPPDDFTLHPDCPLEDAEEKAQDE